MLRARTPRNYTSGYYLFGRWFDKSVFTFMLFTFYWRVGSDESAVNIPNIAGAMFMWYEAPHVCSIKRPIHMFRQKHLGFAGAMFIFHTFSIFVLHVLLHVLSTHALVLHISWSRLLFSPKVLLQI